MKRILMMLTCIMLCGVCYANDDVYISTIGQLGMDWPDPPKTISFNDAEGEIVGTVSWEDGVIRFEGDVDESARLFFEFLLSEYIDLECLKESPKED